MPRFADTLLAAVSEEQHGAAGRGLAGGAVVAIPVKDEADAIPDCLRALAVEQTMAPDAIVLCLNNCTDGSAEAVRQASRDLYGVSVHMLQVALPRELAHAGVARRIAMDRAAELAGPGGIVLTTDADARVAPDWFAKTLAAFASGAEVVAGCAVIEPEGAKRVPAHLHAIDARERAFATLLDEARSWIDPDPFDPWPRHDEHSGASIAVKTEAYHRAGGLPPSSLGEDRDFFDALRRVDARIRHEPGVDVIVSARLHGRAQGGMADTIRRRMQQIDALLDERVEPVSDALRRIRLQAQLRAAWRAGDVTPRLTLRLGLPAAEIAAALETPYFGTAWAELECASPVLQHRRRVPLTDLSVQTAMAQRLCAMLRPRRGERPDDTALLAAADAA